MEGLSLSLVSLSDTRVESFLESQSPALVVLERIGTEDVLDLEGLPKQIDPTILVRDSLISG
jgi:hypothetical protein